MFVFFHQNPFHYGREGSLPRLSPNSLNLLQHTDLRRGEHGNLSASSETPPRSALGSRFLRPAVSAREGLDAAQ